MISGRGATEVYWSGVDTDARYLPVSASSINRKQSKTVGCCVPSPCDVEHCKLAACGLLFFLSLLKAFLLNVIKAQRPSLPHFCAGVSFRGHARARALTCVCTHAGWCAGWDRDGTLRVGGLRETRAHLGGYARIGVGGTRRAAHGTPLLRSCLCRARARSPVRSCSRCTFTGFLAARPPGSVLRIDTTRSDAPSRPSSIDSHPSSL